MIGSSLLNICQTQENARLKAQIDSLRSTLSPLAAAKGKQVDLTSDREKFKKHIENLQVSSHAGLHHPARVSWNWRSHLTSCLSSETDSQERDCCSELSVQCRHMALVLCSQNGLSVLSLRFGCENESLTAAFLQSHTESLKLKLQERQADLKSKSEQLKAAEQVLINPLPRSVVIAAAGGGRLSVLHDHQLSVQSQYHLP